MADAQLPAKPKRIPGLPNNHQLLTFDGFDGLNTKPTRAGLKNQECFVLDNFMPLGKSNVRTLYDVGGAIAHIDSTGQIQPGPPSPPASIAFTVEPQQDLCGFGLGDNGVQVTASDVGFSGTITLALGTNPTGAVLSGTLSVTASAGVANFLDLALDKAGSGYTLVATASGFAAIISSPFDIVAVPNVACFPDNTYLEIDPLTIAATAECGLLMCWFYPIGGSGGIFQNGSDPAHFSTFEYATSGDVQGFDVDGNAAVQIFINDLPAAQWNQDIISWNRAGGQVQWLRNGTILVPTSTNFGAKPVAYTTETHYFFDTARIHAAFTDFFFALPGSFFDLTDPANVAKLRTLGGKPVDISGNPSGVCGVAPVVYFHNNPGTYPTNRGTGGDFTVNGAALQTASTTPWP